MRWKYVEKKLDPDWERWFAWYSVRVGDQAVWLETVLRKHYDSLDGYVYKNINWEM